MKSERSRLVVAPPAAVSLRQLFARILPALLGNCMEFYEYACYASLTVEISNNVYGSDSEDHAGHVYGVWVVFAIGQATRPIGAALFGYVADRWGRTVAIRYAMVGMVVCTTAIGAIPTRRCCGAGWGLLGQALFCILRGGQGLFAAGELASVFAFAVEHAAPEQAGLVVGAVLMTGNAGFLVAAAFTAALEASLSEDALLDWGWRVPFLLALPLGIGVVALQQR